MALSTTTKKGLRYPNLAQAADLAFLLQILAEDTDAYTAGYTQGIFSARPAAGKFGQLYYATDTNVLYLDDGSSWHSVGSIATGSIVGAMLATNIAIDTTGSIKGNIVESGSTRLRVHRTAYGNDRHICSGVIAMSSDVGGGSTGSGSFDRAFSSVAGIGSTPNKAMNYSMSGFSNTGASFGGSGTGGTWSIYYVVEGVS